MPANDVATAAPPDIPVFDPLTLTLLPLMLAIARVIAMRIR